MDIEKSLRKADAAWSAARQEIVRKIQEGESGVVGLEVPLTDGGVRSPKWWSQREHVVKQ